MQLSKHPMLISRPPAVTPKSVRQPHVQPVTKKPRPAWLYELQKKSHEAPLPGRETFAKPPREVVKNALLISGGKNAVGVNWRTLKESWKKRRKVMLALRARLPRQRLAATRLRNRERPIQRNLLPYVENLMTFVRKSRSLL